MNIIVCVKQVPDTEARVQVKPEGKGVGRDNIKFVMSPYDEFALESALRLKEASGGGQIVSVCVGPERANMKEMLRGTLAVGGDKVALVNDAGLAGADSLAVAQTLAAACKKFDHDLILCGKKAVGVDRGQVGPMLAQILGYPFVSNVSSIEAGPDGKTLKAVREVEGGVEVFEVTLPAVLSCEKSAHELRHAPLKGIMMSKNKPIEALDVAGLGASKPANELTVTKMEYPPERTAGKILSGDAAQAVRELVKLLHDEAKVV